MRRKFPGTRKFVLLLGDILCVLLGFYAAYWWYDFVNQPLIAFERYYLLLLIVVASTGVLLTLNGLFSLVKMSAYQVVVSTAVTVIQITFATMAASFILRDAAHSRTVVLVASLFQFVLLLFWNYGFWRMERSLLRNKDVLFVGSDQDYIRILERMGAAPYSNYQLRFAAGGTDEIAEIFVSSVPDVIMLSAKLDSTMKDMILHKAYLMHIPLVMIPEYYEVCCFNMELDKVDDIPVFRARPMRLSLEQRILKRFLDLVLSVIALVLLSPVFFVVATALVVFGGGPVIFKQERVGRDAIPFEVLKFRSMIKDAEEHSGPVLACESDPRITKMGRFLRATRLDELPQLFNVLAGEMSLVGPRPERPVFVDQYEKNMPHYAFRHNVKPGITGMAQIYGKYNSTAEDKLVFDLIYIQKWSMLLDLVIMMQTCKVVFLKGQAQGTKVVDDAEANLPGCHSTDV